MRPAALSYVNSLWKSSSTIHAPLPSAKRSSDSLRASDIVTPVGYWHDGVT